MKYFERDAAGNRLLCRVENFLPYHDELSALLKGKEVLDMVSELTGERAILFKEKVNYKLPGGNGFTAHQDAPAFITFGQKYHITLMISVDATTVENGCLEIVRGRQDRAMLPQAPDGSIDPACAETLAWEPLTTEPGDVLLFDSYIPHRSAKNRTDKPRRAYYITYNRASEGDRRDDYYRDKREKFPPEIERVAGRDYSQGAGIYNVGNPITK
jgi:ectoine hydroxylase-related dioxygenase (phytanoyl-CoA dioxygenase family)